LRRRLGCRDQAGQQVVVHHEGDGAIGFQHQEGVGVVLAIHLLEVDADLPFSLARISCTLVVPVVVATGLPPSCAEDS
jgi:hypothetical protein